MSKTVDSLVLDIPLRVVSEANMREWWRKKVRRKILQQKEVEIEWKNAAKGRKVKLPCRVTLTRIGAKLLDDDNLRGAFKSVRDSVAKLLGADDSPTSPVQFEYKQEAIGVRKYRVIIDVKSSES